MMADAVVYLVNADQPRPRVTQYVLCTMGDMTSLVVLIGIALVCVGLVILARYIINL
jgi:hypothetical protein